MTDVPEYVTANLAKVARHCLAYRNYLAAS